MMASHLEFSHLELRHCHLGFSHLSYLPLKLTQKHSAQDMTLPLNCTKKTWLKLIHSDSTWWWQPSWNSAILNLAIMDSATLVFPLKLTHTCQVLVPTICTKKPSFIHSDSTWWWQPSWILPCWIKKTSLIHSDSTWWWQSSWILPCWIQTPCFLLSDSLKNTLTPLWFWLKLIQSDSNSFILTQIVDGSHLEFCHLEFGHLGFSHLSFPSQTHSHLPRLVPTICTKITFTHSFWLNLMMAAILNSTMLDSDTAILDSDTFLSSLRFTQKHSPSTMTLDSN